MALSLVSKGLVRVKDKGSGPEFEQFQQAEAQAAEAGLGIHSEAHNEFAVRPCVDRDFNVQAWARGLPKGRPLAAIVEWVRDPCSFGCLVVPDFKYVLVNLSGVAGPRVLRGAEGEPPQPQPFYYEAKHVSESLLLNRSVELSLETVEGNGTAVGSILTSEGDIAQELLRRGYGKVTSRRPHWA